MDIKGYENYVIYEDGRVYSRKTKMYLYSGTGKEGYHYVRLNKNGKGKKFYIHRLIAEYYIPNPDNKSHIDHIDGNKLNNNINNLRWVTNGENMNAFKSKRTDNTSGIKNICYHKQSGGWVYNKHMFGKCYSKYSKNKTDLLWFKFTYELLNPRF